MCEIVIITTDARLGHVLAAESAVCGAQSMIKADVQSVTAEEWEHARIALIDLDSKPGGSVPEHVRVLGLCRDSEELPMRARRVAHMLFRRPCRMADLRREITQLLADADVAEHVPNALRKRESPVLAHDSKCVLMGNRQISLSDKEYAVLSLLMQKGESGVSKQELDALLCAQGTNEGQVYICHLRKKLEHAFGVQPIKTLRNYGYRYTDLQ